RLTTKLVIQSTSDFFFSSRGRHTRFSRDWSSDVCSSDLLAAARERALEALVASLEQEAAAREGMIATGERALAETAEALSEAERSEERRVGTERSRRRGPVAES